MNILRNSQLALVALVLSVGTVTAQDGADDRPFVSGGITDKPFIGQVSRTSIGGYTETHFRWERELGLTEELTFDMKRFNLFVYTPVSSRLRVAAEIEFEEKGEEIVVLLHPARKD